MSFLHLHDNCRLYYQFIDSDKAKPVVVFLNGTAQTTKSWWLQAKDLQGQFRILLYDARGQGQSDLGKNELTLDGHIYDLVQLLDYLGVTISHLVGLSHGARLACEFGQRYPDRTNRVVLCSFGNDLSPRTLALIESWYQILKSSNLETLAWSMLPVVFGELYLEKHKAIMKDMVSGIVRRNRVDAIIMHLKCMVHYLSVADIIFENFSPAIVVAGNQDAIIQIDQSRMLAEKLGGHLVQLKGVGHSPNIEATGAFNQIVAQFLLASK